MGKITFRADDELVDELEAFDASKSEVMRAALRTYLDRETASGAAAVDDVSDASAEEVDDVVRDRVDALVRERVDALLPSPPSESDRDGHAGTSAGGHDPRTERAGPHENRTGPSDATGPGGGSPRASPASARPADDRPPRDVHVSISVEGAADASADSEADEDERSRSVNASDGAATPERDRSRPDADEATSAGASEGDDGRPCGQCGTNVDADHVYCPNCGEKTARRVFCECGDEVRSDWAFCPSCGRRTPAADVLDSH